MTTLRIGVTLVIATVSCIASGSEIETHCAAIAHDHSDRNKSVPSGPGAVVMIAIGTVRADPSGANGKTELVVDRTLFGPGLNVVPLSDVPVLIPARPQIYCLSYPRRATEFTLTVSKYFNSYRVFSVDKEAALSAMAQAHLDFLVLRSDVIFVGHPFRPAAVAAKAPDESPSKSETDRLNRVTVDRALYGSGLKAGEMIWTSENGDPLPPDDTYIYFGHRTDAPEQEAKTDGSHYSFHRRWPVSEVARVEETLKRRSLFPIRESVDEYGLKTRSREITFQGTRAEAIALLGSTFDAAQTLAARRLITDGAAAIPEVVAAVEAKLFLTKLADEKSFAHQENLIRLLGILEHHRTDGEVTRLIGQILDKARGGANIPFGSTPDDEDGLKATRNYYRLGTDRNHSLAWLLLTLDERDATRLFGESLLKLRNLTAYGWKDEIQYVVDHSHIEDHLALMALQSQTAKLMPARWQAGFRSDGLSHYALAFSADDRYCAAVGSGAGKIWKTADWTLAGQILQSGSIVQVAFSPDNRSLYVAGGGSREVLEKWDWEAGQIVKRYPGHNAAVDAIQLSPDGKRILSSAVGYRKKSTIVWDTQSGQILDRLDSAAWHSLAWHPEGRWFLGGNRDAAWMRVDTAKMEQTAVDVWLIDAAFSTDGRTLYCLENPADKPTDSNTKTWTIPQKSLPDRLKGLPRPILRVRRSEGFAVDAERALDYPAEHLQLTRDGKQLVVAAGDEVEIVSLPDLRSHIRTKLTMASARVAEWDYRPPLISHDARWLIAPQNYGTPALYDVRTGARLPFGDAHSGQIESVGFVENDLRLRTEGNDGVVCVWDISDKRLIERTGVPVAPKEHVRRRNSTPAPVSEDRSVQYFFKIASRNGRYGPPTSYSIESAPPRKSAVPATDDEDDDESADDDVAPPKDGRQKLGTVKLRWGQSKPIGLVPNGRHFFIGTHIFRRDDQALVSAINVSGEIEQVYFSGDGSRYAIVTADRVERPTVLSGVTQSELVYHRLRIHETQTGQTLLAVGVSAPGIACAALTRDGRSVAFVGRDNSIQVWPVPDVTSQNAKVP